MRKIRGLEVLTFVLCFGAAHALATAVNIGVFGGLPLGDFRGVALTASGVVLLYFFAILIHRCLLWLVPLKAGEIATGSREEFAFNLYLLFYLTLFNSLIRSGLTPVPLLRLVYLALGARMGENTYASGIIFDPMFVELGANCIVGQSALIVPHVIEGKRLAIYPVRIGNDVTIGANAIVMSDVVIGDRAIVAAGAIVVKGTRIGEAESWGGIPAKRLRQA
jgi:serine acetyltransferase